jgi:hypothetical protein
VTNSAQPAEEIWRDYNLLSTFQAQVMPEKRYRQPATLRAAVFLGGAILGREGHQVGNSRDASELSPEQLKTVA